MITYRAGLAGCGRVGATIDDEVMRKGKYAHHWVPYSHAAAVVACPRTELVAVADPVRETAEAIRDRYSVARAYDDYKQMISSERLDILCIATRPGPHAEIAVHAADSGVRGFYCEKPLCNSMRQADAILDACERHGVKFNYGTQRRYKPHYRRVLGLIQEGVIGEVEDIIAHCGAMAAQWGHTHTADMVLMLGGDGEVEFVQGYALADDRDWDGDSLKVDPGIAMGFVQFANGVRAYLLGSGGFEVEVSGSAGKLRFLNNGLGLQLRRMDEEGQLVEGQVPELELTSGTLKGIEDLVGALDDDGETLGNIRLACRSQEMILGMIDSHRQGGVRVSLPLENRDVEIAPDHY